MKKIRMIATVVTFIMVFAFSQKAQAKGVVHVELDGIVKQNNNLYICDGKGIVEYNIKKKKQTRLVKTKEIIYGMLYYKGMIYYSRYNSKKSRYDTYKINIKKKKSSMVCKDLEMSFIKNGRIYFDSKTGNSSTNTNEIDGETYEDTYYEHAIKSVKLNGTDMKTHLIWTEEHLPVMYEFHIFYKSGRYYFGELGKYSVNSKFAGKKKEKNGYKKACKVFKTNFSASSIDFDGKDIWVDVNSTNSKKPVIVCWKGKNKTKILYKSKNKKLSLISADHGYLLIKEGKSTILLNKRFKKTAVIK